MGKTVTNESYVADVRKRVAALASEMLSGQTPFLEGARELVSLRHEAAVEDDDADFLVFVRIDSDTDSLPIGDQRRHWSHGSLSKLQPEIDEATAWAKAVGTDACASLSSRFRA
jgi:hypothetical protein